jgi:Mrp family chromosome partitioning ATPase
MAAQLNRETPKETAQADNASPEPVAQGAPEAAVEKPALAILEVPGESLTAAQEAPESKDAPLILAQTSVPVELPRCVVTLSGVSNGVMASYERVASKVLAKSWNRSSLFLTSTQAQEGSTETAVHLATMLSRRAESALLVDLHLTEPSLWPLLGKPVVNLGFEEALRGHASFDDCVCTTTGEKLEVLLVKQAMSTEEAAHCSGALNDFLEWAEERFTWMIVDCPAVLAPAWTRWFALNADPVVLIACREKTKKHELHTVAKILGDRLAGTILREGKKPPATALAPANGAVAVSRLPT